MSRLVVVGGGISGLAAAWMASGLGFDVTVLEAGPRVGGALRVEELAGVPVDVGAEAILAVRPEGVGLLEELGLGDERISPLTTSARIRAGGADHSLPRRTMLGIPADAGALRDSGAVSEAAVAAVEAEPGLPPLPPLVDDVSVGALVRQRLGDEIVDRLVEPLLGGVYAGRADALSLRATVPKLAAQLAEGGSLVSAAAAVSGAGTRVSGPAGPVFTSLRGGVGRLPQVLAGSGRFEVRTGVTVRGLTRTPTGFALECGAVPVAERLEADAVVVALPAAKAARLLRETVPAAAGELAGIETASSAIVSLAFEGVDPPAGSGLLVAAGERLATKGVTFTTAKWPVESGGRLLLRASVGRAGEPQALQLPDEDLLQLVRNDMRVLTGLDAAPVDHRVTRWGGGLPQYGVGHVERVSRIREAVHGVPGLAVCGASYDGVGVPACIGTARAAVEQLARTRGADGNAGRGE